MDGEAPVDSTTFQDAARVLLRLGLPVVLDDLLGASEGAALPEATSVDLARGLQRQGHWKRALAMWDSLGPPHRRSASDLASDLALLSGEVPAGLPDLPGQHGYSPVAGRVLHVVSTRDVGEPSHRSWLTRDVALETELGLRPAVVTEMGVRCEDTYTTDSVGGTPHHRLPGVGRDELPAHRWLPAYALKLGSVVRKVRPAALVVESEHLVLRAAAHVAHTYAVPLVVDRRVSGAQRWLEEMLTSQLPSSGAVTMRLPDSWELPDLMGLQQAYEQTAFRSASAVLDDDTGSRDQLLEVLEELGLVAPGTSEIAALRARPQDLGHLRRCLTERPRPPLERAALQHHDGDPDEVAASGWQHEGLPVIALVEPVPWRELPVANRSHAFRLQSWEFMDPALLRHDTSPEERRDLDWCLQLALSWTRAFRSGASSRSMAWYDMALAIRVPKLAYLLQEAVRLGVDPGLVDELHASVVLHQQHIFADRAFAAHNNHGFYTAIGQLRMARRLTDLPGMTALADQGRDRLARVMATQFGEDGGHLEHSPDYHRMLLESAAYALDDGLLTDPALSTRLELAHEVLGWFVRPDRTLVQIGDSPERTMDHESCPTSNPATEFLISAGALGLPATETMRILPDTGYAVVRDPQPQAGDDPLRSSYLTLMAGFHSRTHKHADDLSMTWFDGGQEILLDAGRFGYVDALPADSPLRLEGFFYSRPERQYVEGTRAHCTVEADGRDHERRNRTPYGSALTGGWQQDGQHRLEGRVDHGGWRHHRRVVLRPGQWLWVRDVVEAEDDLEHDFRSWWQVADSWDHVVTEGGHLRFDSREHETSLWVQSYDCSEIDTPVRAQS